MLLTLSFVSSRVSFAAHYFIFISTDLHLRVLTNTVRSTSFAPVPHREAILRDEERKRTPRHVPQRRYGQLYARFRKDFFQYILSSDIKSSYIFSSLPSLDSDSPSYSLSSQLLQSDSLSSPLLLQLTLRAHATQQHQKIDENIMEASHRYQGSSNLAHDTPLSKSSLMIGRRLLQLRRPPERIFPFFKSIIKPMRRTHTTLYKFLHSPT